MIKALFRHPRYGTCHVLYEKEADAKRATSTGWVYVGCDRFGGK